VAQASVGELVVATGFALARKQKGLRKKKAGLKPGLYINLFAL
jgi:hypothetical protein